MSSSNAVHVAIELSRSTWLIAARLPGTERSWLHRVEGSNSTARERELVTHPLAQVDHPPAHHAMHRRDRAVFDRLHQGCAVPILQQRANARGLAADQAVRSPLVQFEHPVPGNLQRDTADGHCFRPRRPVIDGCQRQQPPGLTRIMALASSGTKPGSIIVGPQRDRHNGNLLVTAPNQITAVSGKP